jgi:WD40 repeat protein
VIDLATGPCADPEPRPQPVTALAFSPDGKYLVTSSPGNPIVVRDPATGKGMSTFSGRDPSAAYVRLTFSADGRLLAGSGSEGVSLWDAGRWALRPAGGAAPEIVWDLGLSADGRRLVTAGGDAVKAWDVATGKLVKSRVVPGAVTAAVFADGERVVTAGRGQPIEVWDVRSDAVVASFPSAARQVSHLRLNHAGTRLAVTGRLADPVAGVRPTVTRFDVWRAENPEFVAPALDRPYHSVRIDRDATAAAGFVGVGEFRVFDPPSGRIIRALAGRSVGTGSTLDGAPSPDWSFAVDPPSGRIATTRRLGDWYSVAVWGPAGDKPEVVVPTRLAAPPRLAFRRGGGLLAVGDGIGTVSLWDPATPAAVVHTLRGHTGEITSLEFSADGRRLASASRDGHARLWDVDTGAELCDLAGLAGAALVASLSPAGDRLATAGDDRVVRVWDVATGAERLAMSGHNEAVLCAAFSRDGLRLATAGVDRTVRLWDLTTGNELLALTGHRDAVHDCRFTADGARLVTASRDGAVRVWAAAAE